MGRKEQQKEKGGTRSTSRDSEDESGNMGDGYFGRMQSSGGMERDWRGKDLDLERGRGRGMGVDETIVEVLTPVELVGKAT